MAGFSTVALSPLIFRNLFFNYPYFSHRNVLFEILAFCRQSVYLAHNFHSVDDTSECGESPAIGIREKAGIKTGTFHDLRRTAITNWFYEGLEITEVMRLAGHSKYDTTRPMPKLSIY